MKRPFIIKELSKFNPDGVYGVGNQPSKTLLFATEEVAGKDVVVEMKISDGITAYKDLKNLLTPDMPKPTLQSVMEEGNTSSVAMYITGNDDIAPLKDGLLLIKGGILSLAPTDNPTDPTRWQLGTLTVDGEDVGVQLSASTSAAAESALQIRKQSATQAGLVTGSGSVPKGRIALADAINDNEAVTLQQMNDAIALESTNLLHKTGDETKNGNLSLGNEKVFSVSTNTTIGGQVRATNLTNGDFSYMSGRGFVAENQTQAPSKRTQLTKDGVIFDTSPIDNFKQTLLKGSNIAPSSNITISLPNQTGTLALTTDIPSPIDLTPYQLRSEKGQPNGYSSLDGNGNILLSQIPDTLLGALKWGGTYDGSTIIASSSFPELNGQALPDPADYEGVFFVSTANYTQSGINFQTGDWIIAINSSWGKVDNTDAVSSVNGKVGAVSLGFVDLSDVQPTTLYNNDFIKYDAASGKFTNNQLAQVALTNDYNDLNNKPAPVDVSGKANLAGGNTFTGGDQKIDNGRLLINTPSPTTSTPYINIITPNSTTANTPDAFRLVGGNGRSVSGAGVAGGGQGSWINLKAGAGGAATGPDNNTGGVGGNAILQAGDGGIGAGGTGTNISGNGGSAVLQAGTSSGNGRGGNTEVKAGNALIGGEAGNVYVVAGYGNDDPYSEETAGAVILNVSSVGVIRGNTLIGIDTLGNDKTNRLQVGGSGRFTGNITAPSFIGNLIGNADTVTNGVYTTGSYANPIWLTSLDWNKITNKSEVIISTGDQNIGGIKTFNQSVRILANDGNSNSAVRNSDLSPYAKTDASNINVANYKTALNISDGSTLNNNISGTAQVATTYGGQTANFSTSVSSIVNLIAQQPGGSLAVANKSLTQSWLNIPSSGGYDLQSVTDRGSTTTNGANFGGNVNVGGVSGLTITNVTPYNLNTDANGLNFSETNIATRFFIQKTTGNVGIGTTSPSAKLDVNGNTKIKNQTNDVSLIFEVVGIANMCAIIPSNFVGTADKDMLISPFGGNVGIGMTTAPSQKLHVIGNGLFSGTVSVATPTSAAHATTKTYVDTALNGKANLIGDNTFNGQQKAPDFLASRKLAVTINNPLHTGHSLESFNYMAGEENGAAWFMGDPSNKAILRVDTINGERILRVTGDRKVSINLNEFSDPEADLHVAGTGKFTGKVTTTDIDTTKLTAIGGDVEVSTIGNGIILKSPNGTRWRLTVSDAGTSVWTSL